MKYFGCGFVLHSKNAFFYRVHSFSDIKDILIPFLFFFFSKHKIKGVKALDFKDWCLTAELFKTKAHLTKQGLDQIRQIKAGMNKGRD
jgi:site-specific recombinase